MPAINPSTFTSRRIFITSNIVFIALYLYSPSNRKKNTNTNSFSRKNSYLLLFTHLLHIEKHRCCRKIHRMRNYFSRNLNIEGMRIFPTQKSNALRKNTPQG